MWLKFVTLMLFSSLSQAQNWETGDNSSVKACSSTCKTDSDTDRSCWQNSLNLFEESLIIQLRNYISAQIDFDQWYRRHGKPDGQNYTELREQIKQEFLSQLIQNNSEVLLPKYVGEVADEIYNRIQTIATHTLDKVPLYQCPLACSEKQRTMQMTFGISAVLNLLLALAVIPSFIRSIIPDEEEKEQQQGLVNEAYDN